MTDKEIICPKCRTIEYPAYFIHTAHPEENSIECPTCGHIDSPENFKVYLKAERKPTKLEKLEKENKELRVCLKIVESQHREADRKAADRWLELVKYRKFIKQFKEFWKEA